jgi:hypothetical protein
MRRREGRELAESFHTYVVKKPEGAAWRQMRRRKERELAESFHTYVGRNWKELPGDR